VASASLDAAELWGSRLGKGFFGSLMSASRAHQAGLLRREPRIFSILREIAWPNRDSMHSQGCHLKSKHGVSQREAETSYPRFVKGTKGDSPVYPIAPPACLCRTVKQKREETLILCLPIAPATTYHFIVTNRDILPEGAGLSRRSLSPLRSASPGACVALCLLPAGVDKPTPLP